MSSTLDFEARLRRDLTELAGIPSSPARVIRLDGRRRPVTTMVLAAAVVLVLVAAGVGVARLSDRTTSSPRPTRPVGSGPASTTSSLAASTSTAPSTTTAPTPTAARVPLQSVQWASIGYPLYCGDKVQPTFTVQQVAFPTPAAGVQLAAVLVRCNSGAGTPSSALLVYDGATSPSTPHLAATLVAATDGWQAALFSDNGATLSLQVFGFSSNRVANCCPDVHTTLVWNWTASGYVLATAIPPHVTYPQ